MALLSNSRNSLRFSLELATFESPGFQSRSAAQACEVEPPPRGKLGLPILGAGPKEPSRLLAAVSMDFFDRRDTEFWPFVRQAVLWLGPRDAHELVEAVSRLVRDEVPGFTFRSAGAELALQVGRSSAPAAPEAGLAQSLYAVEVGLDLAAVLNEAAGTGNEPGDALSLFRFATGRPQLVAFGQGLRDELAVLAGPPGAAKP